MFYWLILIPILYLLFRPSNKGAKTQGQTRTDFKEYDKGWVTFIKSYSSVVKTKSEKALIDRMLADLKNQGYSDSNAQATADQGSVMLAQAIAPTVTEVQPAKTKAQMQLDNASLLLYFGAFLLVASAGLFVAFGGLNGTIRTLIVLLVAFIMYGVGIWISDNRKRFRQA